MTEIQSFLEYMIQLIKLSKLPLSEGFVLTGPQSARIFVVFLQVSDKNLKSYLEISEKVQKKQVDDNEGRENKIHEASEYKSSS